MADNGGALPVDTTGFRIFPPMAIDELLYSICAPASLTVMVMLRKGLGFRMVPLWGIIVLSVALFGWANIGLIIGTIVGSWTLTLPLYAFTAAFLVMGIKANRHEWRRIKRGEVRYTYSRGFSRLKQLLPTVHEEKLQRIVEPLATVAIGLVLFFILPWPLSVWLIWSGIALAVCEFVIADKRKSRVLDLMDSIAISEVQQRNLAHFKGGAGGATSAAAAATEVPNEDIGLPSDHESDDIRRALERRRRRSQEPPKPGADGGNE